MEHQKTRRSEQAAGRISILFFWTLLMGALLWAERAAWGHHDLIFREMMPWLMPTVAGLFVLAVIALILLWRKGGPRAEKFLSVPFLLYLAAAPVPAILLPWSTIFSNTLQFFSISVDMLFIGLIGYFIGYIFYTKLSPASGWLAGFITANAMALIGYHQFYLASMNAFLEIKGYLSPLSASLLFAGILLVLMIALLLAMKKELSMSLSALLPPFLATVVLLLGTALFRQQIPVVLHKWLALSGIALEVIWLIVQAILSKLKKN